MRLTSSSCVTPSIGCLARGIDRRDDDGVGVVEAGGEIVEQVVEARVAVRLHHGDDIALAPTAAPPCSTDGDLDRVVAVVVDDGDAADDAGRVKRRFTPEKP